MTPLLRITGWMPRRIYLPLECKRGDKARPLFEEVRDQRTPLAVFWQMPGDTGKDAVWQRCGLTFPPSPTPLVSTPLPMKLWQGAVHLRASELTPDTLEKLGKSLEIRLVIRDALDAGLLVTWNPAGFPATATESPRQDRIRTLVLKKRVEKPESESSGEDGAGSLVLQIPLLVLKKLPYGADSSVVQEDPMPSGFVARMLNMFQRDWHFEPRPIRLQAERHELAAEARNMAVMCLDFGTSATAASYIEQVGGHADRPELQPVRDLRPWMHINVLPEFTQKRALGTAEIGQTYHCFGLDSGTGEDSRPQIKDCVPETVHEQRQGLKEVNSQRTTIPSLLYALPNDAEQVLTEPPDAIGIEVEALMLVDRDKQRVETRRFLYAPKLTVSQKPDQYAAFADIRKGRSPVELFLREYFNQLHQELLRLELPVLPIERIAVTDPLYR